MAKKRRKSRKVSVKTLRSTLIKLKSQLTPGGKKQVSKLVKAIDKDCPDGVLGSPFFKK